MAAIHCVQARGCGEDNSLEVKVSISGRLFDFDCGEQTSESISLLPSFLTNFLTYLITYPLCPGWDLRPQQSI